jgi:hypothetical protein
MGCTSSTAKARAQDAADTALFNFAKTGNVSGVEAALAQIPFQWNRAAKPGASMARQHGSGQAALFIAAQKAHHAVVDKIRLQHTLSCFPFP